MKMVDRDSERCPWCLGFEEYIAYHDTEWGVPVHDDRKQFEFLVLESAQAGLSWATILKRRENYRIAFADFDPTKVAEFGPEKIESLMNNEGIIRNRAKVEAAVNNAKRFLEICEEFGTFSEYIWSFVGDRPMVNHFRSMKEVPASTPVSDALAKDMKKRGFKFLGSTTLYAHMQACGLVNDHLTNCFRHSEV
ncbi:MAG: DNA-3-methyladenine glycosylase I [Bacteroidota bacterium]|nr:DNA-3-methyladenine glycosylase I [Bacteroidota bacterium]